jgi:tellurite resistance protein TehA-like permease
MNVSTEYEVLTAVLSVFALALAIVYLYRVIRSYQQWHDERAAVNLSKGIGLTVIAFGLAVSAFGLFLGHADYSVAGLMLARGALIAMLATLILAAVRPDEARDG